MGMHHEDGIEKERQGKSGVGKASEALRSRILELCQKFGRIIVTEVRRRQCGHQHQPLDQLRA